MTTDRIKEIQSETPYPESVLVQQALLKVWNEVAQENKRADELLKEALLCHNNDKDERGLCCQCKEAINNYFTSLPKENNNMEELKKEFEEKFVVKKGSEITFPIIGGVDSAITEFDSLNTNNPDTLWSWIESKIKEAKIEELRDFYSGANKYESALIAERINSRIKELKELKGE